MTKKCVSYEVSPYIATVLRSQVRFHEFIEFMDKVYQMIGHQNSTHFLTVSCKYQIMAEYIMEIGFTVAASTTLFDNTLLERGFTVVVPTGSSLELCINGSVENTPWVSSYPPINRHVL